MPIEFREKPTDPEYPYLIIRLYAAVYQHVNIYFRESEEDCTGEGLEFFGSPPFNHDGSLTERGLDCLIKTVKTLMTKHPFRMCIVLGPKHTLYIELDGSVYENECDQPPSMNIAGLDVEAISK